MDCCAQRNDFRCDDAGDESARGGVVVMDTSFLTPTHFEYYQRAVKEAEAAFDLVSASEPLFVRWIKDPSSYQMAMFGAGSANFIIFGLIYFVFNGLLALQ